MKVTTLPGFLTYEEYASVANSADSYSPLQQIIQESFRYFIHPLVPFSAVILYLIFSKTVCDFLRAKLNIDPKGNFIKDLTLVYSSLLTIYSAWTCYMSWSLVSGYILAQSTIQDGIKIALCDKNDDLWDVKNFGFIVAHFYLSKYYECFDTWIQLLKGNKVMFLQTFHHAGIIIIMWSYVVTKNTAAAMVVVCFNSFIHTIMYTYYTISLAGYGKIPKWLKQFITTSPLFALYSLGITVTLSTLFWSDCHTEASRLSLIGTHIYTVILILDLFGLFHFQVNSSKKVKKEKGTKKERFFN
jgi:hypothetical protein